MATSVSLSEQNDVDIKLYQSYIFFHPAAAFLTHLGRRDWYGVCWATIL